MSRELREIDIVGGFLYYQNANTEEISRISIVEGFPVYINILYLPSLSPLPLSHHFSIYLSQGPILVKVSK